MNRLSHAAMLVTLILTGAALPHAQTPSGPARSTAISPQPMDATPAVIIDSLTVVTGAPVPEEAWRDRLVSRPGGQLNEGLIAHDRTELAAIFRERGYWRAAVTASIDTATTRGTVLTFTVEAGSPVILGTVTTSGPAISDGWATAPPPADGAIFSSGVLEPYITAVTGAATRDGYPGVEVIPALTARGDTVDVILAVAPGVQAVVDSFSVAGLTRTHDGVVLRELAQLRGRPASSGTLDMARALIANFDIVTLAGDPVFLYPDGASAVLALRLAEGPQGAFDGVLGYQPSATGGEGELIGKIDLAFPNLAGTGRSTSFRWENLGADTEDLSIGYREPWIFDHPYAIAGSFKQEQRDRLGYTRTTMQLSVTRSFGHLDAAGGYRYEKISADSLTSSSGQGIDLSVQWTALDDRINPRAGIRYHAAWSKLAKSYRFGAQAGHNLERTEFDFDHFVPTFRNQTVAVMVRYRRVSAPGGGLSPADRYWLGGSTTIRGYREQIFPAREAIWANLEYRFIQAERSRVFVFVDQGYLVNDETGSGGASHEKTRSVTGYGFGLRVGSRAGTLGFDYGLGEGDSPGDGKLHVSLSNYF